MDWFLGEDEDQQLQQPQPLFLLLRNVRNAAHLRHQLIQGKLGTGLAILKPELIPDPTLVQVAWIKALLVQKRGGKWVTRQMATEIVFNLR